MSVFDAAISELKPDKLSHFGPISFSEYRKEQGVVSSKNTASYISGDSLDLLDPALRQAGCMVLRLGRASKTGSTQFAVARVPGESPKSFFLEDRELFDEQPIRTFVPEAKLKDLFPYNLFSRWNERAATQLGFVTGLFAEALELDDSGLGLVPVGGNSVYTFSYFVDDSYRVSLTHDSGQVEVDGLFVAKRGGKDIVFVMEAKLGRAFSSVAKHKLVYPVLGILPKVPADFEVVPVYVRIQQVGSLLTYNVAECSLPKPLGKASLTSLSARVVKRLRLWMPS